MAEFNLEENSLQVDLEAANDLGAELDLDVQESDLVSEEPKNKKRGFSADELNDPNAIVVTIADKKTPIVVLYGPPGCGKTMTLIRLTRFLKEEGYKIKPIKTFRPSYDENYKQICDSFDSMIGDNYAAQATDRINFMLVEVTKNGKRLCQILEAPGENYFNPEDPNAEYPSYVYTIINGENRKIWCVMLEPDWEDENDRNNYVTRIANLKTEMRSTDKTIFVFNKIDQTNFVAGRSIVNINQAKNEVSNLYPGIFAPFKNMNPITRFISEWNCDFIPFQTGKFPKLAKTEKGKKNAFQPGPREYPAKLWNTICKRIKG